MIYHLNQVNESPGLLPSHILKDLIKKNMKLATRLGINELGEIGNDSKSGSGGQEQRVHIFVALVSGSPIILFDEPFSALDINWKNIIEDVLIEQVSNKIIILIGHDCYHKKTKHLKKLTLEHWEKNVKGSTRLVETN
jgi:ABC-type lipoprotein export system ATPase subunit